MVSPLHRLYPLWILGALLSLTDCHCGKNTTLKPTATCSNGAKACTKDADCDDHNACTPTGGEQCCAYAARECKNQWDCCPGQICKRDGHCFDQRQECPNGDSDCGDPGSARVCLVYTDAMGKSDQVCGYAPCDASSPCSDGLTCFRGFCVDSPPCAGHCDEGSICIPQTDTCWPYGPRCMVTCGPGYLAMEKDPNNIWDSCNNRDVECECDELPGLVTDDLGRYASSTTTADGKVAVSMYDGEYGDLVVRTYDSAGKSSSTTYVDGVPDGGTVVAGPSGPRGGVADPGPNVGEYTSIASASDGRLFVSYYDVDDGDLKLAIRGTDGKWSTQTVDSKGDVGLYSSIALDSSGKPAIAYFQRAGATGSLNCSGADNSKPDLVTGVKLARATTSSPASASDWSTSFVECAAIPPPNCYGCNTTGGTKTCVDDGNGNGVCSTPATGCSGCSSSQACTDLGDGNGAGCHDKFTTKPLLEVPNGVGLYPSVAFNGSNVVVSYYDHLNHRLRAVMGTTALSPITIDDGCAGAVGGCHDVGMFSDVAVEPSGQKRVAIAYADSTARSLKLFIGTSLGPTTNGSDSIIDDGLAPPDQDGPSFVGANVNLFFALDGTLWAAYQNSTANDLKLAKHGSSTWTVESTNWSSGSLGWFPHIAQLTSSTKLYISHTQLHTKLAQGHPVKDITPHLEVYTPQ